MTERKKGGKVIASMRKARFSIKGKVQDVGYHPYTYKEILKRGRVRVLADIYKAELKDKPHRSSGEVGQSPCCGAELHTVLITKVFKDEAKMEK